MKSPRNILASYSLRQVFNDRKAWLNGFVLLGILAGVLVQSYAKIARPRLTTDFISWALSSMAPEFGMGRPYVDYWGINPPGVLSMTWLWGRIFGPSLQSYHLLYLICLGGIAYLSWRILLRVFSLVESSIIFGVFGLLFFSNNMQSQFFASEINGMLFSTLGVFLGLRRSVTYKHIFWAHVCFLLAGQMKEVFGLSGVVMLPQLLVALHRGKSFLLKYIFFAVSGLVFGGALMVGYLLMNQALQAYITITEYKSAAFSITDIESLSGKLYTAIQQPKNSLLALDYDLPLLFVFAGMVLMVWLSITSRPLAQKKNVIGITFYIPKNSLVYLGVVCLWIGSVVGFAMQGRWGHKYDLQPLLPMLMMVGLAAKLLGQSVGIMLQRSGNTLLGMVVGWVLIAGLLVPNKLILSEVWGLVREYNLHSHIVMFGHAENSDELSLEREVMKHTRPDECITAVYGWGIGGVYYYSRRPSCSKYFLINLLPRERAAEYTQELIDHPPAAIVYNTLATDLNIEGFESTVFNFSKVLKYCYNQDTEFEELYWPIMSGEELGNCLSIGKIHV